MIKSSDMRVKRIEGIKRPLDPAKIQVLKASKAGFIILTSGKFIDLHTDVKVEGIILYDNGIKDIVNEHSYDGYYPVRNLELYNGEITLSND